MTVKELIKRAMRSAGIISAGETPTADEINDGLDSLNDIIDEWNSGSSGYFTEEEISVPIVSGSHEYYIGLTDPGGVQYVSAERPEQIKGGYIRVNSLDTPLEKYSTEKYDAISNKSSVGTPSVFTYDPIAPSGIVRFWPVPNLTATVKLRVSSSPLTEITSLTTVIGTLFPKSYVSALKWALAVELCPEYGRDVPMLVLARARNSRRKIEEVILARKMTTMKLLDSGNSVGNFYNL